MFVETKLNSGQASAVFSAALSAATEVTDNTSTKKVNTEAGDEATYQSTYKNNIDAFTPPLGTKKTSSIDTVKLEAKTDAFLATATTIAIGMLKVLKNQFQSLDTMGNLHDQLLSIMDSSSECIINIAEAAKASMQKAYIDQQEKIRQATSTQGLVSGLFGFLEVVVGIATIISGGVFGVIAGSIMLINGLTKSYAGMIAWASPEKALSDNNINSAMQNGIFMVFGDKSSMAQTIVMLTLSLASFMSTAINLASAGITTARVVVAGCLLANFALSSYGAIAMLAGSKDGFAQDATMGLVGALLYLLYEKTGLDEHIEEECGKDTAFFIKLGVYTTFAMIGAAYMAKKVGNSLKTEELKDKAPNIYVEQLMKFVKDFSKFASTLQMAGGIRGIFDGWKGKITTEFAAKREFQSSLARLSEEIIKQNTEASSKGLEISNENMVGLTKSYSNFYQSILNI